MKKAAPLVIALILGLVAVWFAMNMMNKKQGLSLTPGPQRPQVVVTKQNVDAGETLTEEKLTLADAPADLPPESAFKSAAELIGRVTTVPMSQGETVTTTVLAPRGTGPGLASIIPIGMRAVTIEINEYTGVAGYLAPGFHVDVVQTFRDIKTGESKTRTIAQNVKITAIGMRHGEGGDGGGRSATLLVTPEQAEILDLSSKNGQPRLSLRGGNDLAPVEDKVITIAQVRGDPEEGNATASIVTPATQPVEVAANNDIQPTTRPAEDLHWTMRVIRADAATDVQFTIHPSQGASEAGVNPGEGLGK